MLAIRPVPSKRETNNGFDRLLFHRADLLDMLKDIATRVDPLQGPPAQIHLASRAASCDCEEGTVKLEEGKQLGPYNLIIGADGM